MYLFVFIFVIMSVLGLYTELFTMRMSQITAQQKSVAETMMVWHLGAIGLARATYNVAAIPAGGCSLTAAAPFAGCGVYLPVAPNPATYLPLGYAVGDANMVFESRVYTNAGTRYVVTFVQPGEMHLGFTDVQIGKQMKNAKFLPLSYGIVENVPCFAVAPSLRTPAVTTIGGALQQMCYPVLDNAVQVIPTGSVAIISVF